MTKEKKSYLILSLNTIAFTICFAVWTMNGVLVTFLVDQGILNLDKTQIGWLIGIPVLTGSVMRLPVGILTDKYGGKPVFSILMFLAAIPTFLLSYATTYEEFLLGSLGFGLTGASFAVGIAYTSVWFSKEKQGTALGIFGAGNAGSALTSLLAPLLLLYVTSDGKNLDAWRVVPQIYAGILIVMAIVFVIFTKNKKVEHGQEHTLLQRLEPLKYMRVWRFGLYYFVVFGGFVALAQWLIPYYVSVYGMSLAFAGLMASIFSFPSGVIRALGGYLSDKFGARAVMYWIFGICLICFVLLCIPKMDIESPGPGVMADKKGVVKEISDGKIIVDNITYDYKIKVEHRFNDDETTLIWPTFSSWQEPVVKVGDNITKKQLLAKGITHIYFQANVWIFTAIVFIIGISMGVGKAAVYKFIPDYYPKEVGVVGGIVGVLGGLGGFICPILFGYMLENTGIWTTNWMFLFAVTLICFIWMNMTVKKLMKEHAPKLSRQIENKVVR